MIIQESPPAWTQEAYHPPCSKYSLCCPNWVPPPILTWGGYLTWVPPLARYPLAGSPQQSTPPSKVPPSRVPPGKVPPPPSRVPSPAGYSPPGWTWQGTPPPPRGCLMAFWEMLQSIMGYGYPPGVNKLTKWNYYLPVVLRTRAVIIIYDCHDI